MVYVCSQCSYSSKELKYLNRHIKYVHTEALDISCPHCDYVSVFPSHTKRHVASVHDKIGLQKCSQCSYTNFRADTLVRHVRTHTGVKTHKCPQCDYAAISSSYVKRHISDVHLKLRGHKCPQCDYCSTRKANLEEHYKTQHDTGHEKCIYCGYTSLAQVDMMSHLRVVHNKIRNVKPRGNCGAYFKIGKVESPGKDAMVGQSCNQKQHIRAIPANIKDHKCTNGDYASEKKVRLTINVHAAHDKKIRGHVMDEDDKSEVAPVRELEDGPPPPASPSKEFLDAMVKWNNQHRIKEEVEEARPMFSVENWLFSVTLRQGARSRALQLRL
jgi:hypothetical protein